MELNLVPFNFTTLLLFSTFIFFLIKSWTKPRSPKPHQNLPPSPPKLPVIGHLHFLVKDLPHIAFMKLAEKHGPIIHLQLGEVPMVVISSREAAKEVLKNQDPMCADRPEGIASNILWYENTDMAYAPYGEYWRQMRKICIIEMLSVKNVRSFGYIRRDEASRLMRSLESSSGQTVDLTDKIVNFTNTMTCRATLGKVNIDRQVLIDLIQIAISTASGFELVDLYPSSKVVNAFSWKKHTVWRMRRKLDHILDGIIEDHKYKKNGEFGGEDIVDVLIRLQQTGELKFPITTDNIKAVVFDMFSGGTETSATTILWAMTEVVRSPRVMEKVLAELREALKGKTEVEDSDIQELKYLKLVIKETLRMHPPGALLPRQTREECTAGGYTIPNKTRVFVNVYSMARDAKYWEEPLVFRPERFENSTKDFVGNDFEYLPFGSGRRICPGFNFALANVELSLAKMLYHFDWKVPNGMSSDLDMSERTGLTVSRKLPLHLVPTLCNPLN